MNKPVINVNNLGKTYWLYPTLGKRLLGCFLSPRMLGGHAFTALEGLSFDLYPGEAIALIGKNGAGKSTALQVLAGITPATEGSFQINGRVCALLELGSGFNPEFTGRQNIALAGILLGLTHEQVKEEEQNIIDFADIGEFIDQPVKFYSSGMFVRLAFAVAVAGTPDLLIVDEALAVGDIFFRQKCYARLREMREKGMAVILVTHSSGDVQEFCDRAILLDRGCQAYYGDTGEALLRYFNVQQEANAAQLQIKNHKISSSALVQKITQYEPNLPWPHLEPNWIAVASEKLTGLPGISFEGYQLTDEFDTPKAIFAQGKPMRVYTKWRLESPVEIPSTGVTIWTDSGVAIYSKGSAHMDVNPQPVHNTPAILYSCHEILLDIACGEYTLSCSVAAVEPVVFAKRQLCDYDEWQTGVTRLGSVNGLATITIILPLSRQPTRVATFGLTDLRAAATLVNQKAIEMQPD